MAFDYLKLFYAKENVDDDEHDFFGLMPKLMPDFDIPHMRWIFSG